MEPPPADPSSPTPGAIKRSTGHRRVSVSVSVRTCYGVRSYWTARAWQLSYEPLYWNTSMIIGYDVEGEL